MKSSELKRVAMPLRKGLRIEAGGCIIYIEHREGGGTLVDVVPDGTRFAGRCMLARAIRWDGGRDIAGEPTASALRIAVDHEPPRVAP